MERTLHPVMKQEGVFLCPVCSTEYPDPNEATVCIHHCQESCTHRIEGNDTRELRTCVPYRDTVEVEIYCTRCLRGLECVAFGVVPGAADAVSGKLYELFRKMK